MVNIRVFQGNQIGGCVTVIGVTKAGKTSRIMIDYGSSLPGSNTKEDFRYDFEHEPVQAVLFTHYHGDHIGRLGEIPSDVPIYLKPFLIRQVLLVMCISLLMFILFFWKRS